MYACCYEGDRGLFDDVRFQEVGKVESRCWWAAMPQGRCDRRREKGCRDACKSRCVSKRQMVCEHQRRWVGSLRRGGRDEMDISERKCKHMEAVRVSRKFLLPFKTSDLESRVKLVSLTGALQGGSATQMLAWRLWVAV